MNLAPLPDSKCPECGRIANAGREAAGTELEPDAGDIAVCVNCGAVNEYTEILTLRPLSSSLSPEELAELQPIVDAIKLRGRLE